MMALNSQYTSDLHATSYMYVLNIVCMFYGFFKKIKLSLSSEIRNFEVRRRLPGKYKLDKSHF